MRDTVGNGLMFWCPGCDGAHRVVHGVSEKPCWTWNGDVDLPTFEPSILVTGYELSDEGRAMIDRNEPLPPGVDRYPGHDTVCHSFVTKGRIQFLSDCTHSLAGQTVDLLDWPLQGWED